jgi:hypothetical protein
MSDSLFRGSFSNPEVARQFLTAWLPLEFVALVEWSTLEVRKIAGITDALSERREDIVLRVKAAGREVHFYLLVEHQTTSPRLMALRVLEYVTLIWRQWRSERESGGDPAMAEGGHLLPLVIPIVLHPGPEKWGSVVRLRDLIDIPKELSGWADSFAPDCGFCLVELAGVPWERLANGHLARAVLAAMQQSRKGPMGFEAVRRIVEELFADEHRGIASQLSGMLWTFLLATSDLRKEDEQRIVEESIPPEERMEFMSTADRLREEGRVEGKGEAVKALREAITLTLDARFGRVPEGIKEALESISSLERLQKLLKGAYGSADLEGFAALL